MKSIAVLLLATLTAATAAADCRPAEVFFTPGASWIGGSAMVPPYVYFAVGRPSDASAWRLDMRDGATAMLWPVDRELLELTADATSLYYATHSALFAVRLSDGSRTTLATVPFHLWMFSSLATDGSYVYFVGRSLSVAADEIWRIGVRGGRADVLVTGLSHATNLTAAEDRLFFAADHGIYAIPKRGGTPALFFATEELSSMAASEDGSLWFATTPLVAREHWGAVYEVQMWRATPPNYVPRLFASSPSPHQTETIDTKLVPRVDSATARLFTLTHGMQYSTSAFGITTIAYEGGAVMGINAQNGAGVRVLLIGAEPPAVYVTRISFAPQGDTIQRFCAPPSRHRVARH